MHDLEQDFSDIQGIEDVLKTTLTTEEFRTLAAKVGNDFSQALPAEMDFRSYLHALKQAYPLAGDRSTLRYNPLDKTLREEERIEQSILLCNALPRRQSGIGTMINLLQYKLPASNSSLTGQLRLLNRLRIYGVLREQGEEDMDLIYALQLRSVEVPWVMVEGASNYTSEGREVRDTLNTLFGLALRDKEVKRQLPLLIQSVVLPFREEYRWLIHLPKRK